MTDERRAIKNSRAAAWDEGFTAGMAWANVCSERNNPATERPTNPYAEPVCEECKRPAPYGHDRSCSKAALVDRLSHKDRALIAEVCREVLADMVRVSHA